MRILCAEDNAYHRDCLELALKRAGHRVDVVDDGEAAWDLLVSQRFCYDLLVSDQNMPRMCGVELVRRIRAAGFRKRIVVYAGNLQHSEALHFRQLNVDLIVEKGRLLDLMAAVEGYSAGGH
jgi:CheY-like chemotaxis protein